jgi:hypothetical protein
MVGIVPLPLGIEETFKGTIACVGKGLTGVGNVGFAAGCNQWSINPRFYTAYPPPPVSRAVHQI